MPVTTEVMENVITLKAANDNHSKSCYILGITFTGAVAGDQCIIEAGDGSGASELYNVKVGVNTSSICVPLPAYAPSGFIATTLSANGIAKVYLRL